MNQTWLTIGDALLFEVPEGQLVFLAKRTIQKGQSPIQVLFRPKYGLIRGIIESFSLCQSDLLADDQPILDHPVKILQGVLYKATENDYFCQELISCKETLKTSWGQFRLFRLDGVLAPGNFKINDVKKHFEFNSLDAHKKWVLNEANLMQKESS